MNKKLYIVMPVYNEEESIENVVEQWHNIVEKIDSNSRLVIFNDGSTDNTYNLLQSFKNKYSQLIAITKPNTGHGPTCLYAYNYCVSENANYIFQTDSDGQTNPDEFWKFWENRNDYDFIIGKRNNRQDGFIRIVISYILKIIIWLIFGESVEDSNVPFRLMNTNKLKPILEIITHNFFLSNVIISMLVVKRVEKLLWLPISFNLRQGGVPSANLKRIIKIGYKSIFDFYRVKQKLNSLDQH